MQDSDDLKKNIPFIFWTFNWAWNNWQSYKAGDIIMRTGQ
jgi:hypothetical protein